ncbi:response regulator transcription factor [Saccharothrix hoggarensis]|uniref:Response regulator transcription factor n=1 Tax=Saccharothrix hoggarensis TaxID=913853 RepID=A0ABW3R0S4_9PSEU
MRVMVVEDDENLRVAVAGALRGAGLDVHTAPDIATAGRAFAEHGYACVVYDRMLPDGDAIEDVQRRRGLGWTTPVLFLTARDTVDDRVAGFAHGGDDYLVKPFAVEELVARVLRLCRPTGAARPAVLRHGDLEVDPIRHEVRRGGVLLTLSAREFAVLEYLASRAGQVVTRTDLIEHCWDAGSDPVANVVEAVVKRLRRKLHGPDLIHTVHGHGYRLGTS